MGQAAVPSASPAAKSSADSPRAVQTARVSNRQKVRQSSAAREGGEGCERGRRRRCPQAPELAALRAHCHSAAASFCSTALGLH